MMDRHAMPSAPYARRDKRIPSLMLALTLAVVAPAARPQSAPDTAAQGGDRSAEAAMAELAKLPPDQRHDCMAASLAAVLLIHVYLPDTPADKRLKAADKLASISTKMKVPRIQKNYAVMAEEVRAHASDNPFKAPKLDAAMADVNEWLKATCPKPKER